MTPLGVISSGDQRRPESMTDHKRAADDTELERDTIDGTIDTMNVDDPSFRPYRPLTIYGDHKRAVSSVQFAPSRLCQSRTGTSSHSSSWNGNSSSISALVASASADGTCKLWNVRTERHDDSNTATTAAPTDTLEHDKKKRKYAPQKVLHPLATCVGHSRGINQVAWNPTAPILCTASDDKTVRLWDAVTSEALVELRGHDNFVFCVDAYGSMIATGSFDETVKVWDVRTGDCVATLPAHSDPVTSVSWNRVDGTTLASSSHDGLCRVWDVATGECGKTYYAAGNPPVASVKYAPNGRYVLTNTLDSTVRLWPVVGHAQKRATPHVYRNATHLVNTKYSIPADFTHAGQIVVGSETGRVVVLDVPTGRTLQTLPHSSCDTDSGSTATNATPTPVVLAVSAHDKEPLIATGTMSTDARKVEFWSAA